MFGKDLNWKRFTKGTILSGAKQTRLKFFYAGRLGPYVKNKIFHINFFSPMKLSFLQVKPGCCNRHTMKYYQAVYTKYDGYSYKLIVSFRYQKMRSNILAWENEKKLRARQQMERNKVN